MLRSLGEFLAVFWALGVVVGLDGYLDLLAVAAIVLLAVDAMQAHPVQSRTRRESLIL